MICPDRHPLTKLLVLLCLPFAAAMASAATPQFNYLLHCGGCHIEDGSGMGDIVPDLNKDMGYFASTAEGRSYLVRVPGAAQSPLSDSDLAELMNWMLRTFSAADAPAPYTEAEITTHRRTPMHDVQRVRKVLLEQRDADSQDSQDSQGSKDSQAVVSQQLLQSPPRSLAPELQPLELQPLELQPLEPQQGEPQQGEPQQGEPQRLEPIRAEELLALGEALFFDTSLSRNGNQSCASCHDPGRAFADPRSLTAGAGVSIGSDGLSLGQRNAPSLTYAAASPTLTLDAPPLPSNPSRPAFTAKAADSVRGGYFWDGREATLERQVLTPFLNVKEMGLENSQELASLVANNNRYQDYFITAGGTSLVEKRSATTSTIPGTAKGKELNEAAVLSRIANGLAAYLRSDTFNSYDSRYDRYLRGEITPSLPETIGMGLFFAPGFTNCATCHQSDTSSYSPSEVFTNHRYENIGAPVNQALLARNGLGPDFRDQGLAMNPAADAEFDHADLNGRFKVPGLRNVAVTAPYMHNGVFDELGTVMSFYNHYNQSGSSGLINPETDQPWNLSNNPDGIATQKLAGGFPLSDRQLAALNAFMRMLTDQRYEHLLP